MACHEEKVFDIRKVAPGHGEVSACMMAVYYRNYNGITAQEINDFLVDQLGVAQVQVLGCMRGNKRHLRRLQCGKTSYDHPHAGTIWSGLGSVGPCGRVRVEYSRK